MKQIYYQFFCTERLGEFDAFFEMDAKLNLKFVTGWSLNDAHWRDEYMKGLMKWAGVEVLPLPQALEGKAEKLVTKAYGI